MATITFKGTAVETNGTFPQPGQAAPDFQLVKPDLSEMTLADLAGKKVIFNIFPSVDTSVCAVQLKQFNERVAEVENTVLLSASMDLPFALARFCGAEGIENAVTTSDFRHGSLATSYGVEMKDGPLAGLYARAVLVLNEAHEVIYSELVSEVTNQPDYQAAMAAVLG